MNAAGSPAVMAVVLDPDQMIRPALASRTQSIQAILR